MVFVGRQDMQFSQWWSSWSCIVHTSIHIIHRDVYILRILHAMGQTNSARCPFRCMSSSLAGELKPLHAGKWIQNCIFWYPLWCFTEWSFAWIQLYGHKFSIRSCVFWLQYGVIIGEYWGYETNRGTSQDEGQVKQIIYIYIYTVN